LKLRFANALAFLSCFGVWFAAAREVRAAESAISLSLEAAVSRAVAAAPIVTRARSAVREAEARRVGAGLVLPQNPRLTVEGRPLLSGGSGKPGYGATLDFLFDVGGAPRARIREAERFSALAQAGLAYTRTESRAQALESYVRAQVAELRIVEADAALVIARRVLEATERRAHAGAGSELEVSSSSLGVAELQADRLELERQRDLALMSLREALDLDAGVKLVLTSPVNEPPSLGEVRGLVERALASHPELRALQARVALLRATEARLEAEVFPRLGVYVGVDAAPLSPTYGVLGLSVELPVAQRNQGPRTLAARERESAEVELGLEARVLTRAVESALSSYEASRRELERLTQQAVPAAARTLFFAEAGFEAGRFDVFRLLNAARDSLRVRASRIDAIEAAWLARIELERAVGGEVKS